MVRTRERSILVGLPCRPEDLRPPTDLRATVVAASFALTKEFQREREYLEALPRELHDQIRYLVPLSWVPLPVALAHYRAMQRAFPDPSDQLRNGRLGSERTQKVFLETLVRALRASGQLTALDIIKRIPSAFERLLRSGGGVAVYGMGPKDARVEMFAHPLVEVPYVRNGWQGMFESGINLACRKCFIRQDIEFATPTRIAFDIAWV